MVNFDEYKFFAESAQYLSKRRQDTTQTYVTVNTAIFAVLAFIVKDAGFRGWSLVATAIPLFLTGVVLCIVWQRIITQHKKLIGWYYDQLREMEARMPASYGMFTKEWQSFYQPQPRNRPFEFSALELWPPRLFLFLYAAYAIGLVVAVLYHWV